MNPRLWMAAAGTALFTASGCALITPGSADSPGAGDRRAEISAEVYRRAESERADRLAREVMRLRADLRRAEEALVAAESGLRGNHSRADAVSTLATARIQVERAASSAPWRSDRIADAREKLDDADRQVREGHFGAALFFVYRALRISDEISLEAQKANASPGTRFVKPAKLNLRAGPSTEHRVVTVLSRGTPVFPETRRADWVLVRTAPGSVGWVHEDLIGRWGAGSGPAAPR